MWGVVVRAVRLVFGLYLPVEGARLIAAGLYHVNWLNVIPGRFSLFSCSLFITYILYLLGGEGLDTFPLVIMFIVVKFNSSQFRYGFKIRWGGLILFFVC